MKDYYQVLGISKNATEEEIKKAYRYLAHQYHPDKKGGDEKKFKEISEAYQVLSNQEKRAQYDRFGQTFDNNGTHFGREDFGGFTFDLNDVFDNFFGGNFSARGETSPFWGRRSWTTAELQITFSQAILGDAMEVGTQEGKIQINIPAGVQNGETLRLQTKNGDYIFIIKIKIPQKISKKAQDLLRELRNEGF